MQWDPRREGQWRKESVSGLGALLGRLFVRPRFEVWAAGPAGGPLYLHAGSLSRRAARRVAAQRLRERPGVPVLVLDESGQAVSP